MPLAARTDKLLIHEIGDELVVYDRTNDRAHRLNATAARVWRSLDGKRTVADLAALIGEEKGVVELALGQLRSAQLLVGEAPAVSRRRALRRVAAAAAAGMVLPMVSSIAAPAPEVSESSPKCYDIDAGGPNPDNLPPCLP